MTTEQMDTTDARRKREAAATPVILYGNPSQEEIAAARGRAGSRGVLVVPEEMRNEGLLVARDDEPERTYDKGETTMAEEPIEDRLRRAWLNGFKEGVERASYSATESWGRWDS